MVPDKFDMVDMGGIDIVYAQGTEVPGLYQKLVESITQCRYQCLYNWMFDGVLIPPTYVQLEVNDNDNVVINEGIEVDENDVVHVYSLEPAPIVPVIEELSINENGIYGVPAGVDGYNPVVVNVPDPPLQSKIIYQNGIVLPDDEYYGLSSVDVNVPSILPVIESKTITENGIYSVPAGVDGFNPVIVNIPTSSSNVQKYFQTIAPMYSGGYEYSGYLYGTQYETDWDLDILADASQGGSSTLLLSDYISNYSGIILQGIYNRQRTSYYNTSIMYLSPVIGNTYWAGMKDRNTSYTCYVTISSDNQVTLSGNMQVIIFGIP